MEKIGEKKSLTSYDDRIRIIFDKYLKYISPLVFELELQDVQFPTAILNEIRGTFTHLAKSYVYINEEEKEKNIGLAENHIKRAILDCYKYSCFSYLEEYKEYIRINEPYDLDYIDNGEFLKELNRIKKFASEKLFVAKEAEISEDKSSDDVYELYENSYNEFVRLHKFIESAAEKLRGLKAKNKKKDKVSVFLAVSGWIVGLLSLILAVAAWKS